MRLKVWPDGTTRPDDEPAIWWMSDDYITFDDKTPVGLLINWVGQEMAYYIIQEYMGYE